MNMTLRVGKFITNGRKRPLLSMGSKQGVQRGKKFCLKARVLQAAVAPAFSRALRRHGKCPPQGGPYINQVLKRNLLNLRRGKISCLLLILKTGGLVRAIAKRLVGGMPATAKRDGCPSAETIAAALHIDEFDFPFDAQRTIIANSNFIARHSGSLLAGPSRYRNRSVYRGVHLLNSPRLEAQPAREKYFLILRHGGIDFIRPGQYAAPEVPELLESGLL